jgi:exodeoxyribonuclease V alpha subunit
MLMDQILGYVDHIVFSNPESGFTVAKLKESQKKELTLIVGSLPSIQPGETLLCEGSWKQHPTHGKQFEVASHSIRSPSDLFGIQKYLESGLIKGIGPVYAKKIVDAFGLDTLVVLDQNPRRLKEIAGIGEKKIEKIVECWSLQKSIREVMIFLRTYEISPSFAQKVFKRYGEKSLEKIKENPFSLAKEIFGIGFKSADKMAQKMGFSLNDPKRLSSGIEYLLWEMTNDGHTCSLEKELLLVAQQTLLVEASLIQVTIDKMVQEKQLVRKELLQGEGKKPFLWLNAYYYSEEGIAKEISRLKTQQCSIREIDLDKAIEWVQKRLHMQFAKAQIEGIRNSLFEKLHVITGGPGTGKSTIINAILTITEKITDQIVLAAPTGRAAKRMGQITKRRAQTIHSLLEYDFSTRGFKKNRENPLKGDLFIIDECSMIDTFLMFHLLRALPSHARLILVGDIDQLPSVGAGYVLKDLIASKVCFVTELTEIFRQASGSTIILNAHRINKGEFPLLSKESWSDFQFFEVQDPLDIQKKILSLVSTELPQTKHLDPFEDIQVLSPMKKGVLGCENLNLLLQNELNPSSTPFFRSGQRFHIGDKVMQTRNNYNKEIFNGDIGRILSIDPSEQILKVSFEGREVDFEFYELEELQLSYAVSVHKYQGSECPCIVMPIHVSHFKLLYRNLLYTAVTRGKKRVVLIGTKQAIAMTIRNKEVQKRYTGLQTALCNRNSWVEEAPSYEMLLPGFKF